MVARARPCAKVVWRRQIGGGKFGSREARLLQQFRWQVRGSVGKNLPANAADFSSIPGSRRFPWREMATHSSILAWQIPRTEEPGVADRASCFRDETEEEPPFFAVLVSTLLALMTLKSLLFLLSQFGFHGTLSGSIILLLRWDAPRMLWIPRRKWSEKNIPSQKLPWKVLPNILLPTSPGLGLSFFVLKFREPTGNGHLVWIFGPEYLFCSWLVW